MFGTYSVPSAWTLYAYLSDVLVLKLTAIYFTCQQIVKNARHKFPDSTVTSPNISQTQRFRLLLQETSKYSYLGGGNKFIYALKKYLKRQ